MKKQEKHVAKFEIRNSKPLLENNGIIEITIITTIIIMTECWMCRDIELAR